MKSNVTMENERFMKRFCVKAENQQEAYYILTPHMMEYIIKMADKSDGTVYRNRHSSAVFDYDGSCCLCWTDYFLCICRQSAASYIVKTKSGYYLFVLSAAITD